MAFWFHLFFFHLLLIYFGPVKSLACIQDGARRISERGNQLELHWIYRQPRCFGSDREGSTLFSSWSILHKVSQMWFLTYTVDLTVN